MRTATDSAIPSTAVTTNEPFQLDVISSLRSLYGRQRDERDARIQAALRHHSTLSADPLLAAMVHSGKWEKDERHNLGIVIRPPPHIVALLATLQQQLSALAGNALWLPPPSQLHLTLYEIIHSRTYEQLQPLVAAVRTHGGQLLTGLPLDRVMVDAPLLNYDQAAVAVTFLPVDGVVDGCDIGQLRAQVEERLTAAGIKVDQRYVPSSAHVTIARFIQPQLEGATMEQWLAKVDELRELCRQWQGSWRLSNGKVQVMANKSWYGAGDVLIELAPQPLM